MPQKHPIKQTANSPPCLPNFAKTPSALSSEANKAVHAFLAEGQSPNTTRTYETALRYWGAWHTLRYGVAITGPVPATAVLQFIVDHLEHQSELRPGEITAFSPASATTEHLLPADIDQLLVQQGYKAQLGPWSLATVETRLAALSKAHAQYIARNTHLNLGPEVNPLRDPRVGQLMSAVRRAYARRGRPSSRPAAATRSVMEALLSTCESDLIGIRDRALLLFGWASGGRRRSEITAASFDNVRREGEGFIYDLSHSKTNQSGARDSKNFKPIQGAAAQALAAWIGELLRRRITEGPLFRRVLNGEVHEPLRDAAVRDIVRRRAKMTGLALGRLSAHSLRSGFVTEAGKQGVSLGETMALTGHRSVQTVMGYYQSGEVTTSRASRLMEHKK